MAGEYRTGDLALAVLLTYHKFSYVIEKLSETHAVWAFDISEEKADEFDTLVDQYEAFEAEVEPRRFVALWSQMRRELFRHIPRPVKPRPAPAT